ncbi:MAG: 3-oxoadipate enol-lactonase [Alphaproteobacteria bacterium]|nr:3-oxoadipate enol-lactonase [Alphaproteobacteria bacterium]MCB9930458.1 3-oxoadipate enol-lactonase [Alphaproteobacteria bacterium]
MVEHAEVNGTRIAYRFDGPAGAPVLTMSHSLSADHRMWDPQLPALTDAYRVLRFDTRGHGASAAPAGEYTLDQLAGDVIGLWDALGIERSHFCGLSMGGMIGQTLGLQAPERLQSLVLCDTASGYPPEAQAMWGDRIKAARANGLAAGVDGTIDRWFSPGFVQRAPDVIEGVRRMIAATPVDGYCGCGAAIARLNLTHRLGEIATPTLVICGEDDPGTPVAMSEAIRDGIPGARLVILPVARHLSNMEDVSGFNTALRDFLDRN